MSGTLLTAPRREWWCPNCVTQSVTQQPGLHVEFHSCPGLRGVWTPMFERGERGHIVVVEREDYQGRDKVTKFDGRPVMRVEKWVGDNQRDVVVFAPSGQRRLALDDVAESMPREVRRKGSTAMRQFIMQAFRRKIKEQRR